MNSFEYISKQAVNGVLKPEVQQALELQDPKTNPMKLSMHIMKQAMKNDVCKYLYGVAVATGQIDDEPDLEEAQQYFDGDESIMLKAVKNRKTNPALSGFLFGLLSEMYKEGYGVDKDDDQANMFAHTSAKLGSDFGAVLTGKTAEAPKAEAPTPVAKPAEAPKAAPAPKTVSPTTATKPAEAPKAAPAPAVKPAEAPKAAPAAKPAVVPTPAAKPAEAPKATAAAPVTKPAEAPKAPVAQAAKPAETPKVTAPAAKPAEAPKAMVAAPVTKPAEAPKAPVAQAAKPAEAPKVAPTPVAKPTEAPKATVAAPVTKPAEAPKAPVAQAAKPAEAPKVPVGQAAKPAETPKAVPAPTAAPAQKPAVAAAPAVAAKPATAPVAAAKPTVPPVPGSAKPAEAHKVAAPAVKPLVVNGVDVHSEIDACFTDLHGFGKKQVDTIRAYGHAKEVLAAKVPVGFFLVALCQFNGFGTPKSADNAAETLSEHVKELIFAAGQGDKYAEYGAGYCYLYGIAIDKNVQNALDCFKRSAEKGFAPAMVCLGKIYADKGDKDLARSWYKKAADLFDAEGQFLLSQIEIDTEYCEYLRKSCADQGYAPGISAIAKDYWDGKGMERNRKKAIELWGLAADKGDTDAIFSYCDALIKAIDIVTDVDYLKLIMPHIDKLEARHGNLFQIGMDIMIYRYHRKGIGGNEFPITKGMEFIEKSVSDPLSGQDNENNYNLIWEYFTNNLYHKKDKKIALTFIKKHAEAGSEAAKRELKLI